MRARFAEVGWDILDTIFPPRCAGCGNWGKRWCKACQKSTQPIGNDVCTQCGTPHAGNHIDRCDHCLTSPKYFNRLRSLAYYEGAIQGAIRDLKYHRNFGLAISMGQLLVGYLQDVSWKIDLIVPVPLSEERFQERGYNQALLLAKPVAWNMQIPLARGGLKRVRDTQTQVGLSRSERIANVRDAFFADRDLMGGNAILVIDDVVTTGATMNACAKALREANAEQVYGLTLARSFQSTW